MKDLTKDCVYGLTGELGLVAKIVELTNKGCTVCPHATHSMGLGGYLIAYQDVPTQAEPEAEEPIPENKDLQELNPDYCSVLDSMPEEEVIIKPDFEWVKTLLVDLEEPEAKAKLIEYAVTFEGIDKDAFDKRKSFAKLLATFQGKWGYISRKPE